MGKIIIEQIPVAGTENHSRKIRVLLPDDYDRNLSQRYPVLYMHDGQNMTDPSPWSGYSWNVERIISSLEHTGKIPGIIVVGIDTDDLNRLSEFSQAIDKRAEKRIRKICGGNLFVPGAFSYSLFLVEALKPYIDQKYRTLPDREHTGTFGSSCGGNISIFLGTMHSDVFGIIGAFSPAYWLVKEDLFQRVEAKQFPPETWIYHDMGLKEEWHARWTFARDAQHFHRLMAKKGFDASDG